MFGLGMPGLPVARSSDLKRFCAAATPPDDGGGATRDGDGDEVVDGGDVVADGVEIEGGGGTRGVGGMRAAGTAMVTYKEGDGRGRAEVQSRKASLKRHP